jgi:PhzF family phenazine biosynthesis protein
MPAVEIVLVNAFVDGESGGNPAAVVLEGDRFTPEERQAIAARVGVSETAFVCASESADVRLVFYTPTRPINHCGHATVAAFSQLVETGRLTGPLRVNETVDGPRRIRIDGGRVYLEQVPPTFDSLSSEQNAELMASLGLGPSDLLSGFEPLHAFNGNGTLLVPLKDEATLAGLEPDMEAVSRLSEALKAIGFYVFVPRPGCERQAAVRMFAPAYGIREESATGMMAGPLGYWLATALGLPGEHFLLEQGRLMHPPSPSLLQVEVASERVWVGGRTKAMARRSIDL